MTSKSILFCFLVGIGFQELILLVLFIFIAAIPYFILKAMVKSASTNGSDVDYSNYKIASFGKRFLARFIDSFIVIILSLPLSFLILQLPDPDSAIRASGTYGILIFCLLYQPILEHNGGTLGKRILKIKTIDLVTGHSPSLGKSYLRSSLYFIFFVMAVLPSIFSCLAVLWSPGKQTLHDRATNILVINTGDIKQQSSKLENPVKSNLLQHADELKKLKDLLDNGIITQPEYENEKYKILNS